MLLNGIWTTIDGKEMLSAILKRSDARIDKEMVMGDVMKMELTRKTILRKGKVKMVAKKLA